MPEEEEVYVPPPPPKEVEVKPKVDREGNIAMKFNQKLMVPGFISQAKSDSEAKPTDSTSDSKESGETPRQLIALEEIDVARDIMDVTFQ
jgi:hypothetical protein